MPPPRTGTLIPHGDHFDVRVAIPGAKKKPPRIHLPPGLSHEQALAQRDRLQRLAEERIAVARAAAPQPRLVPGARTWDAWAESWFTDRERRGLSSVGDDRSRWGKWISPKIGSRPAVDGAVTKEDVEDIVASVDTAIIEGEIAWRTGDNIWVLLSKAFKDAVASKNRELRVLTINPALGVRGPEKGEEKALQYLTPAEFLRLVSCEDAPLPFRRAVVLAVFLLVRASELVPLEWPAVDLEAGVVTVHTALDKKRQKKSTKTKKTRRVPIHPNLRPLLVAMREESGGRGRVIPLGVGLHLARSLQNYLRRAGVTRAELYTNSKTSRAVRFHDCRSAGITWLAIEGLDALKIMARSGHEDFKTMQGYVRQAEVLAAAGTFGETFPPLPLAALGVRIEDEQRAAEEEAAATAAELAADEVPDGAACTRSTAADDWTGLDQRSDQLARKPSQKGRSVERETGFESDGNRAIPDGCRRVETNDDDALPPSSSGGADRRHTSAPAVRTAAEDVVLAAMLERWQADVWTLTERAHHGAAGHLAAARRALLTSVEERAAVVDLAAERAKRGRSGSFLKNRQRPP